MPPAGPVETNDSDAGALRNGLDDEFVVGPGVVLGDEPRGAGVHADLPDETVATGDRARALDPRGVAIEVGLPDVNAAGALAIATETARAAEPALCLDESFVVPLLDEALVEPGERGDPFAHVSVDQISEPPPAFGQPGVRCDAAGRQCTPTPTGAISSAGTTPAATERTTSDARDVAEARPSNDRGSDGTPRATATLGAAPPPGRRAPAKLDPKRGADVPLQPPKPRPRRRLSPRERAIAGGVVGFALTGSIVALLLHFDGPGGVDEARSGPPSRSALRAPDEAAAEAAASASATPEVPAPAADERPGVWRVSSLSSDESIRLVQGKLGQNSLTDALTEKDVPKAQVFRLLKAFGNAKRFDKPRKNDAFVVALDRGTKRVKAFEYQASVSEVWQAKEGDDGRLVGAKLDLHVEQHRVAKAVVVKDDLKSAVIEAGFDDDILDTLDDVLDDRVALSSVHKGAALRIIAQEQTVAGKFARYVDIEAVEYTPAKRGAEPVRIYHLKNGSSPGYYDARGHAPYKGGWRYPVKFPRITSRFNPKRMHPVLHVVKPHNGCDFGAPVGTPVYAASHGTVDSAAPRGPSGNLVLINHSGGLQTGYAHLSRFAPGLKTGDQVEARQLIGFVGSTGRSTGPHLHFSLKKDGTFADPLTLKMDGERTLPKSDRDAFDALRAQLDVQLDAIPKPDRPGDDAPEPPDEPSDEASDDSDAPASSQAAAQPLPPPEAPAPAAPSPAPTDTSLESAIWKPE